jgi:hypothetical protein
MKRRIYKKRCHRALRSMMLFTCRLWGTHDRWMMMVKETPDWHFVYTTRIATDEFRLAKRLKKVQ